MGPKKRPEAMDIPAQIANLKANNLIIEDEAFAARILQRISYYRLIKAYDLSFKVKKTGRYRDRTTFNPKSVAFQPGGKTNCWIRSPKVFLA
jgi:abortive infection bacteriophage resistance protein